MDNLNCQGSLLHIPSYLWSDLWNVLHNGILCMEHCLWPMQTILRWWMLLDVEGLQWKGNVILSGQSFTSHGSFRSYLHKIGNVESPDILPIWWLSSRWCKAHSLNVIGGLKAEFDLLDLATMVRKMLKNKLLVSWNRVSYFVKIVLWWKKLDIKWLIWI